MNLVRAHWRTVLYVIAAFCLWGLAQELWNHGLGTIWFNYFWSSDKGNGPEAIQQTVVYAAIGIYFIPKVRAWVNNHVKSLHDKMDAHHAEHIQLANDHHAEHMAKLDTQHAEHLAAIKSMKPKTVKTQHPIHNKEQS